MKLILASLLILVLAVFPACTKPADTPPPGNPPPADNPPPASITQEDVDAARQVVFDYWEAFNNYDVEGVLAYLEEPYRLVKEESITSEIGQMQSFNATLGVEEEALPTITPEGKVKIKIKLSTPLGARHVTYDLVKINNEWKICLTVEE